MTFKVSNKFRKNPLYLIPFQIRKQIPSFIKNRLRRLLCQHTHTFSYDMPGADRRNYCGESYGPTARGGLALEGCYLCGQVNVRDWRA